MTSFTDLVAGMDPARRARVSRTVKRVDLMTKLVAARDRAGVTQTAVAEALGTTQPGVSRIERQDDWLLSTLLAYADAVGVELTFDVEVPS